MEIRITILLRKTRQHHAVTSRPALVSDLELITALPQRVINFAGLGRPDSCDPPHIEIVAYRGRLLLLLTRERFMRGWFLAFLTASMMTALCNIKRRI